MKYFLKSENDEPPTPGVCFSPGKRSRKWKAYAFVNGVQKTIGHFMTKDHALAARAEFLKRLPAPVPKRHATGLSYQPSKSSAKPWLAYVKQAVKGWKYLSCFPTKEAAEKAQSDYYREQECSDLFNPEV